MIDIPVPLPMDVSRDQEIEMAGNLCVVCKSREAEFGDSQCVVCQDRREPSEVMTSTGFSFVPIKVPADFGSAPTHARLPVVTDDEEAGLTDKPS